MSWYTDTLRVPFTGTKRPHEVWRSLAIDFADSWPRSVILCGLPLRGGVAVVPSFPLCYNTINS
ncbi:unnamed protein product [Staurois parvus]|uniref:Uncharacterized protein n=1 Tax=Staurois parvus TaxID=386267 RepID=A0ABN9H2H9_9NEOB|nr:unnamed protein product [Staurois parvus]